MDSRVPFTRENVLRGRRDDMSMKSVRTGRKRDSSVNSRATNMMDLDDFDVYQTLHPDGEVLMDEFLSNQQYKENINKFFDSTRVELPPQQYNNVQKSQLSNKMNIDDANMTENYYVLLNPELYVDNRLVTFVYTPYLPNYRPTSTALDIPKQFTLNVDYTMITIENQIALMLNLFGLLNSPVEASRNDGYNTFVGIIESTKDRIKEFFVAALSEFVHNGHITDQQGYDYINNQLELSMNAVKLLGDQNINLYDVLLLLNSPSFLQMNISVHIFLELAYNNKWLRSLLGTNLIFSRMITELKIYYMKGVLQISDQDDHIIGYTILNVLQAIEEIPDVAKFIYEHGELTAELKDQIGYLIYEMQLSNPYVTQL